MQQDSRDVLQSGNAGHFSPGTVNVAKNLVIHAAATNQKFLGFAGTLAQAGQQSLQYNKAGKAGPLSPLPVTSPVSRTTLVILFFPFFHVVLQPFSDLHVSSCFPFHHMLLRSLKNLPLSCWALSQRKAGSTAGSCHL